MLSLIFLVCTKILYLILFLLSNYITNVFDTDKESVWKSHYTQVIIDVEYRY